MGLTDPPKVTSKPFKDVFSEGEPFILDGIRIVKAKTKDYGDGEMVCLTVRGQEDELSIWGTYLLHQAKAADNGDFGKRYALRTRVVDGFSQRPVKVLDLMDAQEEAPPF